MSEAAPRGRDPQDLAVLAGIDRNVTRRVLERCTLLELETGQVLFREGEPACSLYLVVEGDLDLSCRSSAGHDVAVGDAQADAVLGSMTLLASAPHSVTATARGPVRAVQLSEDLFGELVAQGSPVAANILRQIRRQVCLRLRTLDERIDGVYEGGAPAAPEQPRRLLRLWRSLWPGS